MIGDNLRYDVDYFLDNGFNWSFGINTRFNSFKADVVSSTLPQPLRNAPLESGFKVPVEYYDFTTRLYLQTTFADRWALSVGLEHKFLNVHTDEIVNDETNRIFFDKSHYINLVGKVMLDTYDSKVFPKKGFFFNADYIFYTYSSDFNDNFTPFSHLYGRLGIAQTFWNKFTLHLISEAGVTLGTNANEVLDYHLGGYNENYINTFVPFYGYGFSELNESAFLRTALTARYEIFKKNFLSFTGNFARINDDIWNDGDIFEDTRSGYAFGYGLNTVIGPIELVYSWNPGQQQQFLVCQCGLLVLIPDSIKLSSFLRLVTVTGCFFPLILILSFVIRKNRMGTTIRGQEGRNQKAVDDRPGQGSPKDDIVSPEIDLGIEFREQRIEIDVETNSQRDQSENGRDSRQEITGLRRAFPA